MSHLKTSAILLLFLTTLPAWARPNLDLRKIHGWTRVVKRNATYKVKIVDKNDAELLVHDYTRSAPFPRNKIGAWGFAEGPLANKKVDFTIQYVTQNEDFTICFTETNAYVTSVGRQRHSNSRPPKLTKEQRLEKYRGQRVYTNHRARDGRFKIVGEEGLYYDPRRDKNWRQGDSTEIIRLDDPDGPISPNAQPKKKDPPKATASTGSRGSRGARGSRGNSRAGSRAGTTNTTQTANASKPPASKSQSPFQAGADVFAPLGTGLFQGTITEVVGDKAKVKYANGDTGEAPLSKCLLATDKNLAIGTAVLAAWKTGAIHTGSIQARGQGTCMIKWDSGNPPSEVEARFVLPIK